MGRSGLGGLDFAVDGPYILPCLKIFFDETYLSFRALESWLVDTRRHDVMQIVRRHLATILLLGAVIAIGGCDRGPTTAEASTPERPEVVVTTTMLTDLARTLGGDAVEVTGIMSPGGDPHLYQPTPQDARTVANSDLAIRSGLTLEGWMKDLIDNAGGERPVVVASDGVDAIRGASTEYDVDPHFWFDLNEWRVAVDNVTDGLVEVVGRDTPEAQAIERRADAYRARIAKLHQWVGRQIETIPEQNRVLITSHDAFAYFGRTYDIRVVGIQGISTEQEAAQRDVADVIDLVNKTGAPAVFVETSVNPSLIEQVARETGVRVAGPLYSDSIGPAGSPAETFVGTVVENVRMITEGLGGSYEAFDNEENE